MIWAISVLAGLTLVVLLVAWQDVRGKVAATQTDMAGLLAESRSLFDAVKKYLDWSIEHGNLNDQHKAKMQEFLAGMQKNLPGQVKEAVKEATLEAAEEGSGVIVLPPKPPAV